MVLPLTTNLFISAAAPKFACSNVFKSLSFIPYNLKTRSSDIGANVFALGYAYNLDLNDLAPQLYQIIDDYRENIYQTVSNNISNASISVLWIQYLNNNYFDIL